MLHQADRIVRHLLREFSRRAQDQRAGGGGLEVARAGRVLALALGQHFALGCGFGHGTLVFGALLRFGRSLLLEQGVQHGRTK